ncbi:MAG: DUF4388 domain-containing protein [Chloroflexi bacterium]|nr:DUF4388 domain-containing protein [Chloroflexota bacterium]
MALSGDLAEVSASELLSLLTRRGVTGALSLGRDGDDAVLVFAAGRLVAVTSSAASLHLETWLAHPGRLPTEQHALLLADPAECPPALPLGARLRSDRLVVVDGLAELMASQAETILARVLGWPDGDFHFTAWPATTARARRPDLGLSRMVYAVAGTDRLAPRLSRHPATGVVKVRRLSPPPDPSAEPSVEPSAGPRR